MVSPPRPSSARSDANRDDDCAGADECDIRFAEGDGC